MAGLGEDAVDRAVLHLKANLGRAKEQPAASTQFGALAGSTNPLSSSSLSPLTASGVGPDLVMQGSTAVR